MKWVRSKWRRRLIDLPIPTPVESRTERVIQAALAQVPDDSRKILVVHPGIDNFPLIKSEAAKIGLHLVRGNPQIMRPGEAYLVKDSSTFLKKESWE